MISAARETIIDAHWMLFQRTLNPQTGGTEGLMWMQPLLSQY